MLVWINGPLGVGKTATAFELRRRLPGSAVCDPEHVGFGMRRMLPASLRGNFQDIPAWRHAVRELLGRTLAEYDGTAIVPMTVVNPDYYQEIIGGLRDDGFEVRHFALLAEPGTVVRRLRGRSVGLEPWRQRGETDHLAEWLRVLGQPEFAQQVHTDRMSVAEVADTIASSAGLAITPSADGPLRAWLRRYATTVRNIHWNWLSAG
jgi:hypothetical protein